MITKVTMFTVICDHCKIDSAKDSEFAGWNCKSYSEEVALEAGWIKEDGSHYCPECVNWDDNDELELSPLMKDKYLDDE